MKQINWNIYHWNFALSVKVINSQWGCEITVITCFQMCARELVVVLGFFGVFLKKCIFCDLKWKVWKLDIVTEQLYRNPCADLYLALMNKPEAILARKSSLIYVIEILTGARFKREPILFWVTPDNEIINNYISTMVYYKILTVICVLKECSVWAYWKNYLGCAQDSLSDYNSSF